MLALYALSLSQGYFLIKDNWEKLQGSGGGGGGDGGGGVRRRLKTTRCCDPRGTGGGNGRIPPPESKTTTTSSRTNSATTVRLRLLTAASLFGAGFILGPLIDRLHSRVNLVVHQNGAVDIGPLHTNVWVPPLLGLFYVVVGSLQLAVDHAKSSSAAAAAPATLEKTAASLMLLHLWYYPKANVEIFGQGLVTWAITCYFAYTPFLITLSRYLQSRLAATAAAAGTK